MITNCYGKFNCAAKAAGGSTVLTRTDFTSLHFGFGEVGLSLNVH